MKNKKQRTQINNIKSPQKVFFCLKIRSYIAVSLTTKLLTLHCWIVGILTQGLKSVGQF